jgi:hypothetical protein
MNVDLEQGIEGPVVSNDDAAQHVDDADIDLLFQRPYSTNRSTFAVVAVLLVLINSFGLHNFVATEIIESPPQGFSPTDIFRKHMNKSQNFSDTFVQRIEVHSAELRLRVNATFANESSRVAIVEASNADLIQAQLDDEHVARLQYDSMVSYLKGWTRAGNRIPYYSTVATKDQLIFETSLQLENGAIVKELGQDSLQLKRSLAARVEYDQEYLLNKTAGLIPNIIPDISASLIELPNLEEEIRGAVLAARDKVIGPLVAARHYCGDIYDSLKEKLVETQLGLMLIGVDYLTLLETVMQFYSILDSINFIGLDANLFPRIDLGSFPSPEFYTPDITVFPIKADFLAPLDASIALLEEALTALVREIVDRIDVQVDINAATIISQLVEALTPNDYHPPAIVYGKDGKVLSPSEAFHLDAKITANLTSQANKAPPLPVAFPETPPAIRDVKFDTAPLGLIQTSYQSILVQIPDLDKLFPPILKRLFQKLWEYWVLLEYVIFKIVAAMQAFYAFTEGTAVPEPVLDIRTRAEKRHQKKMKSSKWIKVCGFLSNQIIISIVQLLVATCLVGLLVLAGRQYYVQEFEPNCILSRKGTSTGNRLVGSAAYNQALSSGHERAIDLNVQSHLYMQQQCQLHSFKAYAGFNSQVLEFETSKAKTVVDAKRVQDIQLTVDTYTLCQQHELACQTPDAGFNCTLVGNPCTFVHANVQVSATLLHDVEYTCTYVESENMIVKETTALIQEELDVQEGWCVVEWYFLSWAWRLAYTIFGFTALRQAFNWTMSGLVLYNWTKLRPEKYKSNCTTDLDGHFTQPEYGDPEEWKKASTEYKLTKGRFAKLYIMGGVGVLFLYIAVILHTAEVSTSPVWFDGSNP